MTILKFQVQAARPKSVGFRFAASSLVLLVSFSLTVLAGCGGMVTTAVTGAQPSVALQGNVHGGQQPVSGATIQLYAAQATGTSTTGYGSLSTPLISSTVKSDAGGNFTITNDYTCPAAPNDQVYLVATQGDPGAGANANISLMAALGPCTDLTPSTFINVNEVTTVASAYALSGFMTDYKHVGTSSTNYQGLVNAFATVNNLVNISTGQALTVTPAYATQATGTTSATFKSTVPQNEIYTLANVLAACVNTNGLGGTSPNCANLFAATTPSGGAVPTDTIQAALNIALNPGSNVTALYNLASSTPPFSPTLTSAPNDWTIALNFIGGGLGGSAISNDASSSDLALDASGNVWISNFRTSTVTELSNLGAPMTTNTQLTPTVAVGGYSGAGISNPNAIAIDTNGKAWLANTNGTISELTANGSAVGAGFTGGGMSGSAKGIAIDGLNNVWVTTSVVSEFDTNGIPMSGTNGFTSSISSPTGGIAVDGANNVWVVNGGNGEAVKLSAANGLPLYSSASNLTAASAYAAVDATSQLWVPQGSPNSGAALFNTGSQFPTSFTPSSISNAVSVSIDGAGHVWIANAGGAAGVLPNLTELSGTGALLSTPGTGYQGSGTALITSPRGHEVDSSGNLWLSNGINPSTVTEFVGIAAPTITPLAVAVKNNKIGTKP